MLSYYSAQGCAYYNVEGLGPEEVLKAVCSLTAAKNRRRCWRRDTAEYILIHTVADTAMPALIQAQIEMAKTEAVKGGPEQLDHLRKSAQDLSACLIGAPPGDHAYIREHLLSVQIQLVGLIVATCCSLRVVLCPVQTSKI